MTETPSLADGLARRGAQLVTGGTENHIVLIDVSSYGITGRPRPSRRCLTPTSSATATPFHATPRAVATRRVCASAPPRSRRRGFGPAESDRDAELIVEVLAATTATRTRSGGTSKAKYTIAHSVAGKVHDAAHELLTANPLHPGLDVTL